MLTRFAPSPTGYLHIGNIRTALICYLYAQKEGGKFLLRIDDTDTERSKQEYIDAIFNDLAWLGITPDVTAKQSERVDKYDDAVAKLKNSGHLYPCYETAEELEFKRKIQLGRGMPPVYDRSALKLSQDDVNKFESDGRKPHWRFKLSDEEVIWDDEIRGEIKISPSTMSDPILIRENGGYTYMLPSTVDDIDFSVTNVLRGEDHISNTAIQIQMFQAMGANPPKFAHNSLIKSKEGKLSKRQGDGAVGKLRDAGIRPMAVNSFLAKIGSSDSVELKKEMQQLIDEFDISKFSKSPTLYSLDEIERINTKALHETDFEEVKARLPEGMTADFWLAVRDNVENVDDAAIWWKICKGDIESIIDDEDKEFLSHAAELLPQNIDEDSWNIWVAHLKDKSGRKGKKLFMPIRKALTGMEHGPELKKMLPLIGREEILKRLG